MIPCGTTVTPQASPSNAETMAAMVSQYTAAPGLRRISPPSTAGSSQTPYSSAWLGGNPAKAPVVAVHRLFQAQNTTPNATPSTDATTMSMVRHLVMVVTSQFS